MIDDRLVAMELATTSCHGEESTLTLVSLNFSSGITQPHFLHFLACGPIPPFLSDRRPISSSSTTIEDPVTVHLSAQSFKSRRTTEKNPVEQDEHAKITLQGRGEGTSIYLRSHPEVNPWSHLCKICVCIICYNCLGWIDHC